MPHRIIEGKKLVDLTGEHVKVFLERKKAAWPYHLTRSGEVIFSSINGMHREVANLERSPNGLVSALQGYLRKDGQRVFQRLATDKVGEREKRHTSELIELITKQDKAVEFIAERPPGVKEKE